MHRPESSRPGEVLELELTKDNEVVSTTLLQRNEPAMSLASGNSNEPAIVTRTKVPAMAFVGTQVIIEPSATLDSNKSNKPATVIGTQVAMEPAASFASSKSNEPATTLDFGKSIEPAIVTRTKVPATFFAGTQVTIEPSTTLDSNKSKEPAMSLASNKQAPGKSSIPEGIKFGDAPYPPIGPTTVGGALIHPSAAKYKTPKNPGNSIIKDLQAAEKFLMREASSGSADAPKKSPPTVININITNNSQQVANVNNNSLTSNQVANVNNNSNTLNQVAVTSTTNNALTQVSSTTTVNKNDNRVSNNTANNNTTNTLNVSDQLVVSPVLTGVVCPGSIASANSKFQIGCTNHPHLQIEEDHSMRSDAIIPVMSPRGRKFQKYTDILNVLPTAKYQQAAAAKEKKLAILSRKRGTQTQNEK